MEDFFMGMFGIKIETVMKITINNIIYFMKNKQNLIITDKKVKEIKINFIEMLKN